MASKRFLMVPVDSSAARMPLPGAVMASATLLRSARFIHPLLNLESCFRILACPAGPARRRSASLLPQNLDPWQRFALHPFQEGAARCGHICELFRDARHIEGGDRISAAGDRYELAGLGPRRRILGDLDGGLFKWMQLESPERPVPHQGGGFVDGALDSFNRLAADVEHHAFGRDGIDAVG